MRPIASASAAQPPFFALTPSERAAVWALRRVAYDAQVQRKSCALPAATPSWSLAGDLARMASTFASVFAQREATGLRQLRVNPPGSLALTRDERRLLNAIAASQSDEAALADNYLFKMAANSDVRRRLADAVMTLAATLAVQGHWLPMRASGLPLAAAMPPPGPAVWDRPSPPAGYGHA